MASELTAAPDPDFSHLRSIYLVLHISGGQLGLPIIILTYAFSKRVRRHPTLVNLWITWVIYSVSYCILIYSGQSGTIRRYPPSLVCRAQSALIHGAPPMSAIAGLIVVVQTWFTFRDPKKLAISSQMRWPKGMIVFLALPYVTFIIFGVVATMVGQRNLQNIASNSLYCTLNLPAFGRFATPTFCSVVMVVLIGFESAIFFRYLRQQKHISEAFPLAERRYSISLTYRILLFTLYSIMLLSVGIFFISDSLDPYPFMVQAALPLVAALVFGTQKDLLQVWCFWKRPKRGMPGEFFPSGRQTFPGVDIDGTREAVIECKGLTPPLRVHFKDAV